MVNVPGKINFKIQVAKSKIHGQGLFAKQKIEARKKIGHLSGILISKQKARELAKQKTTLHLVELWNGKALDCSDIRNEIAYINHSCKPNSYMRNRGNLVEFYALRQIDMNEELTCNYGETHHDGKLKCRCGSVGCVGSL
jgi:uncharacterized protein